MDRLKNNFKFEAIKSFVPSLYQSSKDKMSNVLSPMLKTEADYLMKTESTDKEIIEMLLSKIEMEIILGLKFVMSVIYE